MTPQIGDDHADAGAVNTLQRRITFTGRMAATLRWDVFNIFDRANFGNPSSDITGTTAGTISTLAGDPRLMQFSVRIHF